LRTPPRSSLSGGVGSNVARRSMLSLIANPRPGCEEEAEDEVGVTYRSDGELGRKTEPRESGEGGNGHASGEEVQHEDDACRRRGIGDGEEEH